MKNDYEGLHKAMQNYFEGLYRSDTGLLAKVFHSDARYICAVETPMINIGMQEYFAIVDKREAPAVRREERRDNVTSIQFAGPDSALVTAQCSIGERYFSDLLSFVRVDSQWRIIAKLFHYDIQPNPGE